MSNKPIISYALMVLPWVIVILLSQRACQPVDCEQCAAETKTVTILDTIMIPATKELVYHNTKKIATSIEYTGTSSDTLSSNTLSEPLSPTHRVIDSIRQGGVGLTFDHLIRDNDIVSSRYKITYPSSVIRMQSTTTTRYTESPHHFDVGISAVISPMMNEVIPNIGYRYKKIRLSAGYGLIHRSVMVSINREF